MDSQKKTQLTVPRFVDPASVLLVVSPYYREVTDHLMAGAHAVLDAASVTYEQVMVPGALEIPTAIGIARRGTDFDGYVALGCVIRGETTHYETVCSDSSRALQLLGLDGCCVGNGILTVENYEQAKIRADPAEQDKGGGAATAVLHLIALTRKWPPSPTRT